jgi:two-component system alkaline phosphatase synthesis response regulator PhoP
MVKICLIEDEKSLSDLIQMNLEMEGYEVTSIQNGKVAFDLSKKMDSYQLIILDVMLPEVSGLDICKEVRKHSAVPILFLSAKGTTEDRIAGLKLGGNDYLSKPFDLEELLLRVHNLTIKPTLFNLKEPSVLNIGSKEVNFETYEVKDLVTNVVFTLSKKEIELLRFFSEKENIVISRDEILDRIWGKDQFPTSRTIDNYILSFRKLFENDPKSPEYFHSIRAVGYKFTRTQNRSEESN